jgi:TRAP-type mannitol/chloroaromatic compound transport system permease small subunit
MHSDIKNQQALKIFGACFFYLHTSPIKIFFNDSIAKNGYFTAGCISRGKLLKYIRRLILFGHARSAF